MGVLTIELPPQRAQTEFNLRRWSELLADAELARFEGRVETDRYGHVVMSPPRAPNHGSDDVPPCRRRPADASIADLPRFSSAGSSVVIRL